MYAIKTAETSNPLNGTMVREGDIITYTVTIYNNGHDVQHDVEVTDVIPAGTTYETGSAKYNGSAAPLAADCVITQPNAGNGNTITWSKMSVPADGKVTLTFQVKVDKLAQGVTEKTIRNVASLNGEPTNETIHYQYGPLVSASKKSDPVTGSIVKEGKEIEYTITVRNDGTDPAYGVVVTDQIPTGTTYNDDAAAHSSTGSSVSSAAEVASDGGIKWVIGKLEAGEVIELTFSVTVDRLLYGVTLKEIRNAAVVDGEPTN